jgi:predicted dehydrogenase
MFKNNSSRRRFISTGALALSSVAVAGLPAFGALHTSPKIRIGIIGVGSRGTGLLRLLNKLDEFEIVACCDIREDNLNRAIGILSTKVTACKDYRSVLDDKRIDAVVVATPLYLHYVMASNAIDAGKHVYLEKTMTYDIPQALALVEKVKHSKLILQIGHQYRYYGLYNKVKQVLDEKWLGKVTHFECQYHRNSNWRSPFTNAALDRVINWRMYKEYSGGLMAELCGHQIDVVNWMLDAHPIKVTGLGGIDYWKDGRETFDNVRAVFEYPEGVKLSTTSILSNAFNGYTIKILGDKATLEIQRDTINIYPEAVKKEVGTVDGVTGATLANRTEGQALPVPFDYTNALKLEATSYSLLDFASCVRTGKKPASNVETGRNAAIAVHMANKAMDTEATQYWKPEYSI